MLTNMTTTGYELITTKSVNISLGPNLVVFNPDARAMIIVNYDFQTWLNIANLLKTNHELLSPLTRAYLLHNAYYLYGIGKVNCTVLWELVQYLGNETEYTVWTTILPNVDLLFPKSCGFKPETQQNFVNSVFNKVGLSTNYPTHFPELLSETITKFACSYGNSNCTTVVLQLGLNWFDCIQSPGNDFNNCIDLLSPVHRAAMYCELAKNVTEAFKYMETRLCTANIR